MRAVLASLILLVCAAPTPAQDLPTMTFASAAAADWVTTYRHMPYAREENPLLRWLDEKPKTMIALGVGLDVASAYGWKRLTRKHPKWQKAGLYSAAAFRTFLAIRNTRRLQHLKRHR
jgi:hypothetical protein